MPDGRLLGIYLNDHLAGATVGLELARRARRNNSGSDFGRFLEGLERELEEDKRALEQVIEQLGFRASAAKQAVAIVAERAGRLKLNGQITGYSPLSRVLELEGLTIGVAGKRSLWRNLRDGVAVGDRLVGIDLDHLLKQAESQLERLEDRRVEAARRAFGTPADTRP